MKNSLELTTSCKEGKGEGKDSGGFHGTEQDFITHRISLSVMYNVLILNKIEVFKWHVLSFAKMGCI